MKGFTIIEMLLSVAAIGVIAGISIPIYQSFQTRNDLDVAVTEIAQSLRRAQVLSQAVDGDIGWGVSVQSGIVTIFKGTSYAMRDANLDEIFEMPTNIILSGMSEVAFAKFTGLPTSVGTIALTSNTNEARNITINEKGMVSY